MREGVAVRFRAKELKIATPYMAVFLALASLTSY